MGSEAGSGAGTAGGGLNRRRFIGLGAAGGSALALAGLARPAGARAAVVSAGGRAAAAPAGAQAARGYRLTGQALGVNTTDFDPNFADEVVPGLLAAAGIGRIRYPGGSGADFIDWQQPGVPLPWPDFMALLAQIGAAPMITVNYGLTSLGPASAAAWVTSAQTFGNYSAASAVWVLGNEEYGPWEFDEHPDPHTPESFAVNARPYFEAMHAADPATRVGFPMTIDRTVSGGTGYWVADPDKWNRVVMAANADQVDFVDFHWYPVFGIPLLTNAQLFETTERIPGAVGYIRSILDELRPGTPIVVSESNISQSEIVYNAQPVAALYAVTTALRFLSHGAESYMWWQVHNSDDMNGDFGFLSNGTGTPGPTATALSAAASAGDRSISVADASGLHYAHQFTIGTGAGLESRKITALPGATTLAAAARSGHRIIQVADTFSLTTEGADTNYQLRFAPGTPVDVDGETRVVTAVGTAADAGTLAAPARAGDRTVAVTGVAMGGQAIPVFMPVGFAPGAQVTIGAGAAAETATVASVGTSSSLGTTLAAPASPGDKTLYVTSVANTGTGIATYVGDPLTIDAGAAEEVRTIAAVGSSAAAATTLLEPVAPGDRRLYLASVAGVAAGHPVALGTGSDTEIISAVTAVGAQAATTLASAAAAGDTVITVASATGFTAGHPVEVDTGAAAEVRTIASVAGTAVTLSAPLSAAHAAGASVLDAGTGVILSRPARRAHAAGDAAQDLGTGITLAAPLARGHAAGAAARDAGSGLVLTAPLRRAHADGDPITTLGTGITLDRPLSGGHAAGATVASTAVTITPALARAHASADPVSELGLQEPALDTPMPAYWGFVLASKLAAEGAVISEVTPPGGGPVYAFASYLNGVQTVCLVNTDDASSHTAVVAGLGAGALTTWAYGLENPQVVAGTMPGSRAPQQVRLAPESVQVLAGEVGPQPPPVIVTAAH